MSESATADPHEDLRWMDAALNLGSRSLGLAAPNPAVGAILVKDGAVVGRGTTAPGGRPHAERIAIGQAGEAARGATLYVTLEPCSHFGVSPPCVDAVVAAGVARVVSAMEDPNPLVGGQGHARLREAGIAVSIGVGADQARRDHLGHILRVTAGRPCVTLKLAETADGFASAGANDARLRITGAIADLRVQIMRSTNEAIMVGVETALADDPALTVRLPGLDRKPLRVVLDTHLRLPERSRLAASAGEIPTLVIAGGAAPDEAARRLEDLGVMIERAPSMRRAMSISSTLYGRSPRVGSPGCSAKADRWSRPGSLRSSSPTRSRSSPPTSRSADRASSRSTQRPARRCWTDRDIVPLRRWTTGRTRCGSGSGRRIGRGDCLLRASRRGGTPASIF